VLVVRAQATARDRSRAVARRRGVDPRRSGPSGSLAGAGAATAVDGGRCTRESSCFRKRSCFRRGISLKTCPGRRFKAAPAPGRWVGAPSTTDRSHQRDFKNKTTKRSRRGEAVGVRGAAAGGHHRSAGGPSLARAAGDVHKRGPGPHVPDPLPDARVEEVAVELEARAGPGTELRGVRVLRARAGGGVG
jgi:hypothetical protein